YREVRRKKLEQGPPVHPTTKLSLARRRNVVTLENEPVLRRQQQLAPWLEQGSQLRNKGSLILNVRQHLHGRDDIKLTIELERHEIAGHEHGARHAHCRSLHDRIRQVRSRNAPEPQESLAQPTGTAAHIENVEIFATGKPTLDRLSLIE